jgi:hypothetical protein
MVSDTFTIVAEKIDESTQLGRLESRGTLRIALKKAGLDAKSLGLADLEAVFAKVMPGELKAVGCADADAVCDAIMTSLHRDVPESATHSSDEIMRRLGNA